MSWLIKLKTSQMRNIEEIIISVIRGNLSAAAAVEEISQTALTIEACDQIQTMIHVYPNAITSLRKMQDMLNCSQIPYQQENNIDNNLSQEFQDTNSTQETETI